jgi:large subunit ribosomal protein L16
MLLSPKKVKFKKIKKGNTKTKDLHFPSVFYKNYNIIAIESGYIHAKQIEASRQTINRHLGRKGKILIKIFPDVGITKKPNQVRIGKGAGTTKYWVSRVRPGMVIFEIKAYFLNSVKNALYSGAKKIPLRVIYSLKNNEKKL